MTDPVDPSKIEEIVGQPRHMRAHWARAVSAEQKVYLLHSQLCLMTYGDELHKCPFSRALDNGIDAREWTEDVAFVVEVGDGHLHPARIG